MCVERVRRGAHRGILNSVEQGSGHMTLRRTPYRNPKGRRDKSMDVKRELSEDVYGTVPQRLSDTVKATRPESQSPGVELTPVGSTSATRRLRQTWNSLSSMLRPGRRTMRSERIQGDEREAYVALERSSMTKHGMAYRARALWSRSRHSSRGKAMSHRLYVPPGSVGEPRTGRRAAGNPMQKNR